MAKTKAQAPPKAQPYRKRANQTPLRLDKEEDEAFRAAADRAGMSLQAWIRKVCRERAGLPT